MAQDRHESWRSLPMATGSGLTLGPPDTSDIPLLVPPPLSNKEATFYYAGIPSGPRLVARSGTTKWKPPTGWDEYRKELRPVGNHPLKEVWEGNLALKLHTLLDSMNVKWTSTDVVRTRIVEEFSAPVIVWIGVMPASLCGTDGVVVASKCRDLLGEYNIADVDVEIRESVATRSAGPKLLKSSRFFNPTEHISEPLTATLGLHICAQSTPWIEGTGGFFIAENGNADRLLLVTARHVVLTPDNDENKHFEHTDDSEPRYNIMLFGNAAYNTYLESIKAKIKEKAFMAEYNQEHIESAERMDDPEANEKRQVVQDELAGAIKAMETLNTFYQDVSTNWATPESRVLGHVTLSPPINFGAGSSSEGYTEDWAVIEIDPSKVDATNFSGNVINLATQISIGEFIRMMNPEFREDHPFQYPFSGLLELKGTIPDEEMRHPIALSQDNDPFLTVLKRGNTTGLTVGCANDVFSYARYYHDDGTAETSKEWAILPFDFKSGAFLDKGDSGSVIVDCLGRIGGLLTGGAGAATNPEIDIAYATPINFLLQRMQDNGLREPTIL
ncbi:hypothetical protein FRB99_005631 [Tulasnella sp. 403]|nr:hypothetical protein FRB99_005631 [Tulasnella sp. 403]